MTYHIKLEINQKIAKIILNNPDKHNAFNDEIIEKLTDILNELKNNLELKVVILESCGKSFSAGADLAWMQKMINYTKDENYQDSLKMANMLNLLYNLPQVTIAKIQGAADGGGVGLVACCDIAIASENANFCFSEVKLGLIPAVISPYILRTVGLKQAKRYIFTAEIINSQKAKEINLINEIVSLKELDSYVESLVEVINEHSSNAICRSKMLLNKISNKEIDQDLLEYTAKEISELRVSKEAQIRLKKFLNS